MDKIRNIGIAAHIDAGKTTLTERILFFSGKVHRIGEVDDGSATMDWMPQERQRGITITSAATTTKWRDYQINVIDTPGHVDFTVEVPRALRALDGMIAVFCAVGGVEPQSETVWRQANLYDIPRIAFINKLDRVGADFQEALDKMREKLNARAWPVMMPVGEGHELEGIIDIIEEHFIQWEEASQGAKFNLMPIPDQYKEEVKQRRWELLEALSENNEELMLMLLEENIPDTDYIKKTIRKAVIKEKFVPVFCGTALHNMGIQPLLDGVIEYLPSPSDFIEIKGRDPKTAEEISVKPDESQPFSGVVFKIAADKYVGRMCYLRIYSGQISIKNSYLNPRIGKRERPNKIFRLHSDQRKEMDTANAGDVVGLSGIRFSKTGDTLTDQKFPIVYGQMHFPEPVIFIAIEPKSQADMQKLTKVLEQLQDEDPTVSVKIDPDTGQMILAGMGELHLEILVDRMKEEFGVIANVGNPQVAYRETITSKTKGEAVFEKTIGDHINYAGVTLELFPLPEDSEKRFVLENKIPENIDLPVAFLKAIEESIESNSQSGPIGGFKLTGIGVRIKNVDFTEETATEMAFRIAAGNAFSKIIREANPVLLEPVMRIEILVPEGNVGDVISDLGMRGATVSKIDQKGDIKEVTAISPLSEMFGYTTSLRSLTQGRGTYSMEFDSFKRLPGSREEKILKRIRGY